MRILHVIPGLAYSSGPTHIVIKISEELLKLGCDVSMFYLTGRGLDTLLPESEDIEVVGYPSKGPARYGYSPALKAALRDRLGAFDVAHSHALWMYPNLALSEASRRCGVPYVIAPQGTLDTWSLQQNSLVKRAYGALIERRVLQDAAMIQACSDHETQNIRDFGVETRVEVIPNGIDPSHFSELPPRNEFREKHGVPANAKVVLFLGRLHAKKGLDFLIPAFSGVARENSDVRLMIAGSDCDSGYQAEVKRLVAESGVAHQVLMVGEVQGREKLAALACADLYALTTYSEGLPVAVVEAMASGLPVLLTPGCNIPEAETHKAGCIVDQQVDLLTEAMGEILRDDALRSTMGANAKQLAEERFSWRLIAQRLHGLYRELAKT